MICLNALWYTSRKETEKASLRNVVSNTIFNILIMIKYNVFCPLICMKLFARKICSKQSHSNLHYCCSLTTSWLVTISFIYIKCSTLVGLKIISLLALVNVPAPFTRTVSERSQEFSCTQNQYFVFSSKSYC
jgi:hypothetical protein